MADFDFTKKQKVAVAQSYCSYFCLPHTIENVIIIALLASYH
jgi:hypothetical protein